MGLCEWVRLCVLDPLKDRVPDMLGVRVAVPVAVRVWVSEALCVTLEDDAGEVVPENVGVWLVVFVTLVDKVFVDDSLEVCEKVAVKEEERV